MSELELIKALYGEYNDIGSVQRVEMLGKAASREFTILGYPQELIGRFVCSMYDGLFAENGLDAIGIHSICITALVEGIQAVANHAMGLCSNDDLTQAINQIAYNINEIQ